MKNNYWIEEMTMGGFRSIQNTNVRFEQGLNIIIGKNGGGKTNLFQMIEKCLDLEFTGLDSFNCEMKLHYNENTVKISAHSEPYQKNGKIDDNILQVKASLEISEKQILDYFNILNIKGKSIYLSDIMTNLAINHQIKLTNFEYIRYGLPDIKELAAIAIPSSYLVKSLKQTSDTQEFAKKYYKENVYDLAEMQDKIDELYETINKNDFHLKLKSHLKKYSPLEDIKIQEGFYFSGKTENTLTIHNMLYEYKVNGEWYFWEALSDGTKRIFYLIYYILLFNDTSKNNFLIEEPELGIHPHQLHQLMDFFKEMSEEMQIIITTHSPQVLNILNENELHHINVCEITPNGTRLHKLSEKQMKKAALYMNEVGSLGDYWVHSDLED